MRRVWHFLFCSVHFGGNVEPDSSGDITNTTDCSPRLVCLTSASCWLHNSRKQLCFRPLPNVEDSANLEAFAEGSENMAKYSASMTSMECFFVFFWSVPRPTSWYIQEVVEDLDLMSWRFTSEVNKYTRILGTRSCMLEFGFAADASLKTTLA